MASPGLANPLTCYNLCTRPPFSSFLTNPPTPTQKALSPVHRLPSSPTALCHLLQNAAIMALIVVPGLLSQHSDVPAALPISNVARSRGGVCRHFSPLCATHSCNRRQVEKEAASPSTIFTNNVGDCSVQTRDICKHPASCALDAVPTLLHRSWWRK